LGGTVAALRKLVGLRQEDLARALNVSRAWMAQFETGRLDLPAAQRLPLAGALLERVRELAPAEPHPSVPLAIQRLRAGLTGESPSEAEQVALDAEVASFYTGEALIRMRTLVTDLSDVNFARVVAPLVGLICLFPNVEVSLLVHLLTPKRADADGYAALLDALFNLEIVHALYIGELTLRLTMNERDVVTDLVIQELKEDVQRRGKLAALRLIRDSRQYRRQGEENEASALTGVLDRVLAAFPEHDAGAA
jgi:transcriptional regulator with XRE-family HTH domain